MDTKPHSVLRLEERIHHDEKLEGYPKGRCDFAYSPDGRSIVVAHSKDGDDFWKGHLSVYEIRKDRLVKVGGNLKLDANINGINTIKGGPKISGDIVVSVSEHPGKKDGWNPNDYLMPYQHFLRTFELKEGVLRSLQHHTMTDDVDGVVFTTDGGSGRYVVASHLDSKLLLMNDTTSGYNLFTSSLHRIRFDDLCDHPEIGRWGSERGIALLHKNEQEVSTHYINDEGEVKETFRVKI